MWLLVAVSLLRVVNFLEFLLSVDKQIQPKFVKYPVTRAVLEGGRGEAFWSILFPRDANCIPSLKSEWSQLLSWQKFGQVYVFFFKDNYCFLSWESFVRKSMSSVTLTKFAPALPTPWRYRPLRWWRYLTKMPLNVCRILSLKVKERPCHNNIVFIMSDERMSP